MKDEYDNETFFKEYANMPRSREGLRAAGERRTHFLGCDVVKQHHTLTQILMGLLNHGFELAAVEEAEPPKEMMSIPGMKDELRRPMMLLVKANKK